MASQKKVRFAKPLIQSSPSKRPPPQIRFGSFTCYLDDQSVDNHTIGSSEPRGDENHGRVHWDLELQWSPRMKSSTFPAVTHGSLPNQEESRAQVSILNSAISALGPSCSLCASTAHSSWSCPGKIRCWACRNFGHTRRACHSRPRFSLTWAPRTVNPRPSPRPKAPVQVQHRTSTKPTLVWMPRIPRDKETESRLDSRAVTTDAPTPFHQEQKQSTDCLHLHPPPQFPSSTAENPNLAEIADNVPGDTFVRATAPVVDQHPIVLSRSVIMASPTLAALDAVPAPPAATTSLEIVPWTPVLDVMALQLWPYVLESHCRLRAQKKAAPVIILGGPQEMEINESPNVSGPGNFEFQSQQMQPSLVTETGQKRGRGRPRKVLSLPTPPGNSVTPLVETSVRRSTRFSSRKGGFHKVRIEEEPSKKRNKIGAVLIDDATGEAGPIPIEILQSWGIECGIAPGELSQEAVMQAPNANPVPNEDLSA